MTVSSPEPVPAVLGRRRGNGGRVRRPGWEAPVPVVCCGNANFGGAGKTTLVIDLARRLTMRGANVHILLRGYGGSARGVHRVKPDDPVGVVGDEALLLAGVAPTWTGADRAASARAAIAVGGEVLLMDDGLQNPTLIKTFSLLVIDGRTGFGNGRVLPAGPLRERVAAAAARTNAAVLIGADVAGALDQLPPGLPVLRANLVQDSAVASLAGRRILAFAGIAFPEKFFAPLRQAGATSGCYPPIRGSSSLYCTGIGRAARQAAALQAILVQRRRTRFAWHPRLLAGNSHRRRVAMG